MNVLVLTANGQYDFRIGPLHLVAHGLFKPLQLVMAAFWAAFLVKRQSEAQHRISSRELLAINVTAVIIAIVVHASFASVNFQNPYWTHVEASSRIHDLSGLKQLFARPQDDGFYRPLTFISLLLDFRLFGDFWPAYHVQSILLHVVNLVLVGCLAQALKLGNSVAALASLLFAAAPFTFEAVLWPAARFDLLATTFMLLTLILAVQMLRAATLSYLKLGGVGLLYLLSLLNKESSYCLPFLIAFLIVTRRVWQLDAMSRQVAAALCAVLVTITAAMLGLRIHLFGSLGGYATANGASAHLQFSWRTIEATLTRLLAIAPFTANVSTGTSLLLALGILLLLFGYGSLLLTSGRDRVNLALLGCAFIAVLPAANIIGWIHADAQQSRYLYTPGMWLALFFARLVTRGASVRVSILAVTLGGIFITWSNLSIYRSMLGATRTLAERVVSQAQQTRACRISIAAMPLEPNGIFFFRDELQRQIESRFRSGPVLFDQPAPASCRTLYLTWDARTRTIARAKP